MVSKNKVVKIGLVKNSLVAAAGMLVAGLGVAGLLGLVGLVAGLVAAKSAEAQNFSTCFTQPPNLTPIPCLSDTAGRIFVYADQAGLGANQTYYASAALESGTSFSSGTKKTFLGVAVTTTTVPIYLLVFDAAAPPADGAVVPKLCVFMNAGVTSAVSLPILMTTGIAISASSTGCYTKTASVTVSLFVQYTN